MLEPVLAYYLNKYLGRYVIGLDADSLRISVWKGDVVLKDLKLRPEALEELQLPITVKAGVLGTLRLKVPWAALGTQQVQVEIDRLYVLAVPNYFQDAPPPEDAAEEEARLVAKKRAEIDEAEKDWVQHMLERQEASHAAAAQPGYIQGVINIVLGNLKVKVEKLHVRYEDSITQPNCPFTCGLTLDRLGAFTVDDNGLEMFVREAAMELVRKKAEMLRFAIYFDTDVGNIWSEEHNLNELELSKWDALFLPGILSDESVPERQYVLKPVDGTARYEHRTAALVTDRETAHQDIQLLWSEIAMGMSHAQAVNCTLLLHELSRHQLRRPHASFRPNTRPNSAAASKLWWRYACKAVTNQQQQGKLTWREVVHCAQIKREYLSVYVRKLEANAKEDVERIQELEMGVPSKVALHLRKLAQIRWQQQRKKEQVEKAQAPKRTWMQWLGYSESPAAGAESGAQDADDGDAVQEERGYLTGAEVQSLEKLMEEQAARQVESNDPLQVLSRYIIKVKTASLQLVDDAGVVGTLSAADLSMDASMSKVTQRWQVSLGSASIITPTSDIIRTGAISERESQFLCVDYASKPPETNVDHAVRVRMAPAYVTYAIPQLKRIWAVFQVADAAMVDLSALGAQAASRLQEMQAIAQQQVQAAWSTQPKLDVYLDLHAPKVAIPVHNQDGYPSQTSSEPITLLADLGSLVLASNFSEQASLPLEEASIYDCYRLRSSDLTMHLIKGTFAWPNNPRRLPLSGRQHSTNQLASNASVLDYLPLRDAVAVPLLDHCSTAASIHVAHVSHPTLPLFRVGLEVPKVAMHVSPYRLTQLLRVMRAVLPPAAEPQDQAPWVKVAEYTTWVDVLVWQGFVGTQGEWQRQYAVVHRGTLYFMEHERSPTFVRQVALWQGRRILELPASLVGRDQFVLAVAPVHLPSDRVLEEQAAVVMRMDSEYQRAEWRRRLQHSAARMDSVVNWRRTQDDLANLERAASATSVPSLPDPTASLAAKTLANSETQSGTIASSTGPGTFFSVFAHLHHLALHVSARPAEEHWPSTEALAGPSRGVSGTLETSASQRQRHGGLEDGDGVMVGPEQPLVTIIAEDGLLRYAQEIGRMSVGLQLRRFEIHDRLVGPINPHVRFLARSFDLANPPEGLNTAATASGKGPVPTLRTPASARPDAPSEQTSAARSARTRPLTPTQYKLSARPLDQRDNDDSPTSGPEGSKDDGDDESESQEMVSARSQTGSGMTGSVWTSWTVATSLGPTTRVPEPPEDYLEGVPTLQEVAHKLDSADDSLVEIAFSMWNDPRTRGYDNVDMTLDVSVASLYFTCNRPTVAALMCFYQDLHMPPPLPSVDGSSSADNVPVSTPVPAAGVVDSPPATPVLSGKAGGASVPALPHRQDTPARAGGKQRTLFKLGMFVRRLQLEMAYETLDNSPPLLQCSVTEYGMGISVHPETFLLTATLGNAQLEDCSLPLESPYRSSCGLRSDKATSLINLEFRMHSVLESMSEPRVPDDVQYYSLKAHMNAVTIVYLNRFISESLAYISGLFYYCPEPLQTTPAVSRTESVEQPGMTRRKSMQTPQSHHGRGQRSLDGLDSPGLQGAQRRNDRRSRDEFTAQVGYLVLIDVEMQAPVIEMPRHSQSSESIEVDLGTLHLTNKLVCIPDTQQYMDVMDLTLHRVSARVLSGEYKGDNMIRELQQGLTLHITRALYDPLMELPFVNCHVEVPRVLGVITDREYAFCAAVAISNLREPLRLPASAVWLQEQVLARKVRRRRQLVGQATVNLGVSNQEGGTGAHRLPPRHPKPNHTQTNSLTSVSNSVRATLNFGSVELELRNTVDGRPPVQLAKLHASNLFINYVSDGPGHMLVHLCLPVLQAHDLRTTRMSPSSLVLSSSLHSVGEDTSLGYVEPSVMTLRYQCQPDGAQDCSLRLQRPTLVAEVNFMLAMIKFAAPLYALGAEPTEFRQRDIRVTSGGTVATDHLWLSTANCLLANNEGVDELVYDAAGHAIVLPRDLLPSLDDIPLISVGPNTVLRIKNAEIYNASSLAACVRLEPGAQLHVRADDNVVLNDGPPTHLRDPLALLEPALNPGDDDSDDSTEEDQAAAIFKPAFQVQVTAVGVGVHVVAARAGAENGSEQGEFPLLAAYADVETMYSFALGKSTSSLCFRGLRLESQIVSKSNDGELSAELLQLHGGVVRQGAGITQGKILEPLDLTLTYKSDVGSSELLLEFTDIAMHMSPDVLTIISEVSDTILHPIQAASPAQPLYAVDKYVQVSCDLRRKHNLPPFNAAGSGGLSALSDARGFTFWAPVAPPGHCILGHVLTSGDSPPSSEVVCVALTSGVVAWPVDFRLCWRLDGTYVWEAQPPPDYHTLGCVVTHDQKPPALDSVVCIHENALVAAPVGECLMQVQDGCLWAVDNAAGSFIFCPRTGGLPGVRCYDLRSPLGVLPAKRVDIDLDAFNDSLKTVSEEQPAFSSHTAWKNYRFHQAFMVEWKKQTEHAQASAMSTSTVIFERIWTNKHSSDGWSTAVSIWRPEAPNGYAAVGDCLVCNSWAAPRSCSVLRLDYQEPALLTPPQCFTCVWTQGEGNNCLHIWEPVPPQGYEALGMVATTSKHPPARHTAYCVRAIATRQSIKSPVAIVEAPQTVVRTAPIQAALCVFDEGLQTLHLRQSHTLRMPCTTLELPAAADTLQHSRSPLHVHMSVGVLNVRIRDLLRVPLLELETVKMLAECTVDGNSCTRAHLELFPEIWSHNDNIKAWEPVLEQVPVQLTYHNNPRGSSVAGLKPGTTMEISTREAVHLTLSHAAAESCLRAIAWWRSATADAPDQGALYRHAAAADNAVVLTEVNNTTGETMKMWMDFGDHTEIAELAVGKKRLMQPLARPVLRTNGVTKKGKPRPPPMLLCVSLKQLLLKDAPGDGTTKEYFISLGLSGETGLHTHSSYSWGVAGTSTRCLRAAAAGAIDVDETFLLPVPDSIIHPLANDVNAIFRQRRLRASSPPHLSLNTPMTLMLRLHTQRTPDDPNGVLAVGHMTIRPDWVRQLAQSAAKATAQNASVDPGEELTVHLGPASRGTLRMPGMQAPQSEVTMMVHMQQMEGWLDDSPDQHELDLLKSQRGDRSVKLVRYHSPWEPIVRNSKVQPAIVTGQGVLAGKVLGLRLESGVMLEESFVAGVRTETMRSTVQVVNTLDFPVQVALTLPPGVSVSQMLSPWGPRSARSGHEMLMAAASNQRVVQASNPGAATAEVAEEEVLENQRAIPFKGFSAPTMPMDPKRFSRNRNGTADSHTFPTVRLPHGWEWQGPWRVDHGPNADPDGWSYAVDFSMLSYPFHNGSPTRSLAHFVRRRCWKRLRRRVPPLADATASTRYTSSGPEQEVLTLGILPVGMRMPLPLRLLEVSAEVHFRPYFGDTEECIQGDRPVVEHLWSRAVSGTGASVGGSHNVVVNPSALQHSTRLLHCVRSATVDVVEEDMEGVAILSQASPKQPCVSFSVSELRARDVFFSLTVEGDQISGTGTDWCLTLTAPLIVHNLLPLPADYVVYDTLSGTRTLGLRHAGKVGAGEFIAVYAADVRQKVSMKFVPAGYQWHSSTPVELSRGFSSRTAGIDDPRPLPAALELTNAQTTTVLKVHVERDVDDLEDSGLPMDHGSAMAQGHTMLVRLYVQLWVLNLTQVLISAALMEKATPRMTEGSVRPHSSRRHSSQSGDAEMGGPSSRRTSAGGAAAAPRTAGSGLSQLDCRQSQNVPVGASCQCQVLPGSVELLSYTRLDEGAAHGLDVALQLEVLANAWSPEMVLAGQTLVMEEATGERGSLESDALQQASESLRDGRPVLLRSCQADDILIDVVAHLQVAPPPFQRCKILQISPHTLISNRTGVPIHIRHSFNQAQDLARQRSPAGPRSAPLQDMLDSSMQTQLPAGVMGMPLNFRLHHPRNISICLPTAPTTGSAPSNGQEWSCDVPITYLGQAEMHVCIPVTSNWGQELLYSPSSQRTSGHGSSGSSASPSPEPARPAASNVNKLLCTHTLLSARSTLTRQQTFAVLRMSMQQHSPGSLHVVMHSIACMPPYVLQNRTDCSFQFRQAGTEDRWRLLPGQSAVGFSWPVLLGEKQLVLSMCKVPDATVRVALDPPEHHMLQQGTSAVGRLRVSCAGEVREFLLVMRDMQDGIMQPSGLSQVAGPAGPVACTGMTGRERILVILSAVSAVPRSLVANRTLHTHTIAPASQAIRTCLRLSNVDISIVDQSPEELLFMQLRNLTLDYDWNLGVGARFSHVRMRAGHVQVDDQLFESPLPVALCSIASASKAAPPCAMEVAVLYETVIVAGRRRLVYCTADMPVDVQLAVSEHVCWRFLDMLHTLPLAVLSENPSSASSTRSSPAVDALLTIGIISISNLHALFYFRAAPATRPPYVRQYVSAAALKMLPEALDNVNLNLKGQGIANDTVRTSRLWSTMHAEVRAQVFNIGLSLLTSYLGYLGTSAIGHGLSAGAKQLNTLAGSTPRGNPGRAAPVSSLQDGVTKGAEHVVKGVVHGLKGVVKAPIEGAKSGRSLGLMRGIGKGIGGLVAMPVAGVMEAGAATMQGVNAAISSALNRGSTCKTARTRIQRAILPNGAVAPFDHERALGNALLKGLMMRVEGARRSTARREKYHQTKNVPPDRLHEYFVLPEQNVVLLTADDIVMCHAPEFVRTLTRFKQAGAVQDVQALTGVMQWFVEWSNVLAPEVRISTVAGPSVIIHLKSKPKPNTQPAPPLEIQCDSTSTANGLFQLIQQHVARLAEDSMDRHVIDSIEDAGMPDEVGQTLPRQMPCVDYSLVSMLPRGRHNRLASVWRPMGAPRYCRLGDVLQDGVERPGEPALMYLERSGADGGDDQAAPFKHPLYYDLVWRDFVGDVSMWRGRAPHGYVTLGCMASKGLSPPSRTAMVCVSKELLRTTQCRLFQPWGDSRPVVDQMAEPWTVTTQEDVPWPVSCWQIKAESKIFWAERKPNSRMQPHVNDLHLGGEESLI